MLKIVTVAIFFLAANLLGKCAYWKAKETRQEFADLSKLSKSSRYFVLFLALFALGIACVIAI